MLYLNSSRISRKDLDNKVRDFLGKGMCFDLDGIIIDVKQNTKTDYFDWTWNAMERATGFHKDKEHERVKWRWVSLYAKTEKTHEEELELAELQKVLDASWQGKYFDEVTKDLFPVPWMKNFEKFMERIRKFNVKDERKIKLGIVSAAPEPYIRKVAELAGLDIDRSFIRGCYTGIDETGRMTGEFSSIKTSTRKELILGFCCYNGLSLGELMYHDDHISGIDSLGLAGFSVAVRPELNEKGERLRRMAHVTLTDGNWLEHPILNVI